MKISTVLDQIDLGQIALPEFQRGYVWNSEQVRALMHSLYRKHPVGGLLMWNTKSEDAPTRGDGSITQGFVNLLLDGQQRITSLYGIIRGRPPKFFDGNAQAFTGLHFHLEDEAAVLDACNAWVVRHGLPAGAVSCELRDSSSGDALAILDLAWPNGLQEGLTGPVAVLLDEGDAVRDAALRAGYRCFTDVAEFKAYVRSGILGEALEGDDVGAEAV